MLLVLVASPLVSIRANQPAGDGKPAGSGPSASAENRHRAVQAIRDGQFDLARSMIRAAIKSTKSTSVKHSWRIVESELEFAQKKYAASALIAMRIVILTPESEQTGVALFRAGRAYEKMGRPSKAIELFKEAAGHKSSSEQTRRKAERRIEVLEQTDGKK